MPRSRSSSIESIVAPDAVLALDLVDRVDPLGVEEDALGQRGLARVDVGADADVADFARSLIMAPLGGSRLDIPGGACPIYTMEVSAAGSRVAGARRLAETFAGFEPSAATTAAAAFLPSPSRTRPIEMPPAARRDHEAVRPRARARVPGPAPALARAAGARRRAARARRCAQREGARLRIAAADQPVDARGVVRPVDARDRVVDQTLERGAGLVLRRAARAARRRPPRPPRRSPRRRAGRACRSRGSRPCRCPRSRRRASGPRSARCRRRRRAGTP